MKAIRFDAPGDESVLYVADVASPSLDDHSVRVAVHATAVNRADLLQRRGLYPPPSGASDILGLECAGEIMEVGGEVASWRVGDRVMALLPGGGYAEEATVHSGSLMAVPGVLSYEEAGALPETFLTAFLNIFLIGGVKRGDSVLVHGGGSGVGTAAIALCREAGVRIMVTAGSDEKCRRCVEIGADRAINYRNEDFVAVARGVDLILDPVGGAYLTRNLEALGVGGRLVVIATMEGSVADLDLGILMAKRLRIIGSTLRSRSSEEKSEIIRQFIDQFGAALIAGRLRPVIDGVFPLEKAGEAHRLMRDGSHFGKIALKVR